MASQHFGNRAATIGCTCLLYTSLDAAVAEEWPPAAHILAVLQVDIYHQALFFLITGAVVELALRLSLIHIW